MGQLGVGEQAVRNDPAARRAADLVAASAIGLGHWAGGHDPETRTSSAIVCSLRNPGIALLVASANGLPASAKIMVVCHVITTAIVLGHYAKERAPDLDLRAMVRWMVAASWLWRARWPSLVSRVDRWLASQAMAK